jgi:hypothetical protein
VTGYSSRAGSWAQRRGSRGVLSNRRTLWRQDEEQRRRAPCRHKQEQEQYCHSAHRPRLRRRKRVVCPQLGPLEPNSEGRTLRQRSRCRVETVATRSRQAASSIYGETGKTKGPAEGTAGPNWGALGV